MIGTGKTALTSRRTFLGLGVASAGAVIWGWNRPPETSPDTNLDPAAAQKAALAGDLTLIDIRTPREWQTTGVGRGAIPLDMRRADFVAQLDRITEGNRSRPVALICAGGARSARMTRMLDREGFTRVINVPEGMNGSAAGPGWLRRGLETNPPPERTG